MKKKRVLSVFCAFVLTLTTFATSTPVFADTITDITSYGATDSIQTQVPDIEEESTPETPSSSTIPSDEDSSSSNETNTDGDSEGLDGNINSNPGTTEIPSTPDGDVASPPEQSLPPTTAATSCSVKFTNNSGTNFSGSYAKIAKTVTAGTTITLPAVPNTTGYRNLGWTTVIHGRVPTNLAGSTYKVTEDVTFYAVRVQQFTVKFNNNSGTTVAPIYETLTMVVDRDSTVTLPAVPKATGYRNLGWTTVVNSPTVTNEADSQYTVTSDITFYAVRKKLNQYTVKFTNNSGSNFGSPYDALVQTVYEDTLITLPDVPNASGYKNMGWTTEMHGRSVTNAPLSSYKVTKDITFYAYREKLFTVTFLSRNGNPMSNVKPIKGIRGEKVILPSMLNPANQTVTGWDREPKQRTYPDYDFGEAYTIDGDVTLYAVVHNHITSIPVLNKPSGAYKNIIFLGDSRFEYAQKKLQTELSTLNNASPTKIKLVCKAGAKLDWFTDGLPSAIDTRPGHTQLLEAIESCNGTRTAIIMNLGVNNIGASQTHDTLVNRMNQYRTVMANLAHEVANLNCDLYYMSLNPINNTVLSAIDTKKSRSEAYLLEFNEFLKTLPDYTYIDCYRYLTDNGFAFDSGTSGIDSGVDDGLHYSAYTYADIINYCISQTNSR